MAQGPRQAKILLLVSDKSLEIASQEPRAKARPLLEQSISLTTQYLFEAIYSFS